MKRLAKDRAEAEAKLAGLRLPDLPKLLESNPALKEQLEQTLQSLGVPAALDSVTDLEQALKDVSNLAPMTCNVYRFVAEAYGAPLPLGQGKLYRMPDCKLGKACVNPNHIGTDEDFVRAVNGRRKESPGRSKTVPMVRLTRLDRRFLRGLNIRWD